jgi:hypothetical protein
MRRDVASTIRVSVVAPDTADGVRLFENDEVMPPRPLEANRHAHTSKAGTNNRNRAPRRVGSFARGCNANSWARRYAIVDTAAQRMLSDMVQTLVILPLSWRTGRIYSDGADSDRLPRPLARAESGNRQEYRAEQKIPFSNG